jgi:photosystem II stability/assembly factor-like uncharacterized protein
MNERDDIETALRATLAEKARLAPEGGLLAERILRRAPVEPPASGPRRWGTWTLPLIAAASVLVVVAAVVGLARTDHAGHAAPAAPASSAIGPPGGTPTASNPTSNGRPTGTNAPVVPPPPTASATGAGVGLTHFQAIDLSFVGTHGWALGTADCLNASVSGCAAMVRTTDDGASWHSMTGPPANVSQPSCAAPCVSNVRFATDQIGYAYGPAAFFMTTDGGATWQAQPGGADALETLDGNVIRIVPMVAGCSPPGCGYTAQTAPLGSSSWQPTGLATSGVTSVGVDLSRSGSHAYLLVLGHTAGGAMNAQSALYTSADDGATWTARGEPCPQVGGGPAGSEVDSTGLTTASDGSVTVLCTPRGGTESFTSTSTDGGVGFRAGSPGTLPVGTGAGLAAASSSVLVVAGDQTYRSTDAGRSWQPVTAPDPGSARWVGFESDQVGRAVSGSGSVIYTTRDAGRSWTPFTFS